MVALGSLTLVQHKSPNRQWWNEVTPRHVDSDFYDVRGFLAGRNTIGVNELRALGDITSKRILHLMCHFGLDTLSLTRMGAEVTGVDFSDRSIEVANRLRKESALEQRSKFICADVLEVTHLMHEKYDIVFTSHGILEWLSDLTSWATAIAHVLNEDGFFFIMDVHPFSLIFNELSKDAIVPSNSYFRDTHRLDHFDLADYTDRNYRPESSRTKFLWRIDEILGALRLSGLVVTEFNEYPFSTYQALPIMEQGKDGLWYLPKGCPDIPFYFSLKARLST